VAVRATSRIGHRRLRADGRRDGRAGQRNWVLTGRPVLGHHLAPTLGSRRDTHKPMVVARTRRQDGAGALGDIRGTAADVAGPAAAVRLPSPLPTPASANP
jgi:hypothetical protein